MQVNKPELRGFTLVEVLVAMAIISLGMIAVFTGLNQSLSVTDRVRSKTLAGWIALDQIAELQISGEYPDAGRRRDEVEMANSEWVYEIQISDFPDLELKRLDVTVSLAGTPDDVLASVIGFIGPPVTQATANTEGQSSDSQQPTNGFGDGWEPPQLDLQSDSGEAQ